MKDSFKIVGIGEVLWDVFPSGKTLGGAPANFIYHSSLLGAEGYLVSAVGEDLPGRELISELKQKSISNKFIQLKPNYPTGSVDLIIDKQGKPEYLIRTNVAWDNLDFSRSIEDLAKKADAVCFGTLAQRTPHTRKTIYQFLNKTNENCLRIFDINLREKYYSDKNIIRSLSYANCMKLNDEELIKVACLLNITGDEDTLLKKILRRYNLKFIALTKGAFGSKLMFDGIIDELPSKKIDVVDSVGAGDAFTAALVVAYLNGLEPSEIHRISGEMAGLVCTKQGAMPEIKNIMKDKITIKRRITV